MSEAKHVEMVVADFARAAGVAPSEVTVVGVSKERIPNPPPKPGQISLNPVIYRYFIEVEGGGQRARYVGERGRIRRG